MQERKIKPHHSKPQKYHRDGFPLWGERILNQFFRVIWGVIFFWLLYYPIYVVKEDIPFMTHLSYILLYSSLGSILAMMASFMCIQLILFWTKRPKKGFLEMNGNFDLEDWLYEILAQLFNALVMALGLLQYLLTFTTTIDQFLLIYAGMKIIIRGVSFGLSKLLSKNFIFILSVSMLYSALLVIATIDVFGVSINVQT